ncbi:hypothetical protein ABI_11390 [Asticcacaulis biprosthecium C19]|uniref:Uncharacterized protein n=1 Tax=Asticcacaulis biprosthecium C19 TaxID=715226 RepID=F4QHG5_9CAUL|nr:hypothetical protein ABI_11390 [Asticcacaulis biprosthecium C19]
MQGVDIEGAIKGGVEMRNGAAALGPDAAVTVDDTDLGEGLANIENDALALMLFLACFPVSTLCRSRCG